MKTIYEKVGLTFDDVLLIPGKSDILPIDIDTHTYLTRNIKLNIPLVSAAMDTVTESRLAIALAQEGGIGIIHKNMPIKEQAAEVDKVKRYQSGMIVDPVTLSPDKSIKEALDIMSQYRISGVPITENGKLVGILTNRDLRFVKKLNGLISEYMTKENLITVPIGTTLEEAQEILHKNRIEKLPVVDKDNVLKGLITIKDIEKKVKYPNACKDKLGRLKVGASVGTASDTEERAEALVKSGIDVLVIDTAHGHSAKVISTLKNSEQNIKSWILSQEI